MMIRESTRLASARRQFRDCICSTQDVCRECDKATWVHASTGCYFKWCKGCKRFRNLVAFAEKLAASKCDRCRERGRQGYMRRKGGGPSPPTSPRH
jgi:hypothetical protein